MPPSSRLRRRVGAPAAFKIFSATHCLLNPKILKCFAACVVSSTSEHLLSKSLQQELTFSMIPQDIVTFLSQSCGWRVVNSRLSTEAV